MNNRDFRDGGRYGRRDYDREDTNFDRMYDAREYRREKYTTTNIRRLGGEARTTIAIIMKKRKEVFSETRLKDAEIKK